MVKRYWTLDEIMVNLPPTDCKFVLASEYDSLSTRHARAIEALRLLVHEWDNRTNMADGLAAARAVLDEEDQP